MQGLNRAVKFTEFVFNFCPVTFPSSHAHYQPLSNLLHKPNIYIHILRTCHLLKIFYHCHILKITSSNSY